MTIDWLPTARSLSKRGIGCFPLSANSKIPLRGSAGLHEASTSPKQLKRWMRELPNSNLGAVPGPDNVVIDIDRKSGRDGFAPWKALQASSVSTLVARTPNGGEHWWFRTPIPLPNTASLIADGIDTRGVGGYVVCPPSAIPAGPYEWLTDPDTPIADIPDDLLQILKEPRPIDRPKDLITCETGSIEEGRRNDTLFRIGCSLRGCGQTNDQILAELIAANTTLCKPPLCTAEVQRIVRSISKYLSEPSFTESGNAERFRIRHKNQAVYVPERKQWLVPDNGIWVPDVTDSCVQKMKEIAKDLKASASYAEPRCRKEIVKWARTSLSRNVIRNSLDLARSEPGMTALDAEFDSHPFLLAVNNGVVDLKSESLIPHDLKLRLTKRAPVEWDENSKCPKWRKFLRQIFEDDVDLIRYLQRLLGYAITGVASQQVFPILWGGGKNGKSTLVLVLRGVFGTYACHTQPELFTSVGRQANQATPSLARLQGARLVTTTETEAAHKLAESLVKQLTGDDPIEARGLYQAPREFLPTFTILLATNHLPQIFGTDYAIWRRINLIPFNRQIPEKHRIRDYHKVLLEEKSGILRWIVAGAAEWLADGLAPPETVQIATTQYRQEQDRISQFLQDSNLTESSMNRTQLYRLYVHWAENNGIHALSSQRFYQQMREKGFAERRVRGDRRFTGLPKGVTGCS